MTRADDRKKLAHFATMPPSQSALSQWVEHIGLFVGHEIPGCCGPPTVNSGPEDGNLHDGNHLLQRIGQRTGASSHPGFMQQRSAHTETPAAASPATSRIIALLGTAIEDPGVLQ